MRVFIRANRRYTMQHKRTLSPTETSAHETDATLFAMQPRLDMLTSISEEDAMRSVCSVDLFSRPSAARAAGGRVATTPAGDKQVAVGG